MQTKDQPDAQGQMRRSTDKSFAQDRQAAGAVHFLSARRLPSRADTSALGSRDRRAACGASPLRRNHARMTGGRSMAVCWNVRRYGSPDCAIRSPEGSAGHTPRAYP